MDHLILDKIWYKITNDSQSEYILGSQLIELVKELNKLTDSVIITPDQMDSVNNFSLSNPDIKIYKFSIDEFLNNLIGFKFNQSMGSVTGDKQKNISNIKFNKSSILDDINCDNIKNQNKTEEQEKEENIGTEKLQEEIEHYKNRYDILRREFEFYKRKQNSDQKIPSNELNIDYEYTVNEVKRQIEEQRKLMLNISQNIENRHNGYKNNDNYNIHTEKTKDTSRNMDNVNSNSEIGKGINVIRCLRQFGQILLVFIIAVIFSLILSKIVFPLTSKKQSNDFNLYENDMNMFDMSFQVDPWWTKFNKVSHLIYKFQDWYDDDNDRIVDNTQSSDSDMNAVYDEVFGIKNTN